MVSTGAKHYVSDIEPLMQEWDFEHWGIKYWSKTKEFLEYEAKK